MSDYCCDVAADGGVCACFRPPEILYGLDGDETLELDLNDLVEMRLDAYHGEPAPLTLEVLEFERMKLEPLLLQGNILDRVDELLWESELGGEDGPDLCNNEACRAAEAAFIRVIIQEFKPWACEPNGKKHSIDCRKWVVEHRPEWLPEMQWQGST